MSHFSVLVIGDDIEKQLAPYHEFECTGLDDQYVVDVDITEEALEKANQRDTGETVTQYIEDYYGCRPVKFGCEPDLAGDNKYGYTLLAEDGSVSKVVNRTNPSKKWDWWVAGGRWSDLALGVNGEPVVSGRKKDFDFSAMAQRAYDEAVDEYRAARRIVGDSPFASWKTFCDDQTYSNWDDRRKAYAEQDSVRKLNESLDDRFSWEVDADIFSMSEDEFASSRALKRCCTYAVVKDGQWYARGKMGWFGMSSNEVDDWESEFSLLLNGLPDDTQLTVVDCHI